MSIDTNALLPCPFCGGPADHCWIDGWSSCYACDVTADVDVWNSRPAEARIAELEQELEEANDRLATLEAELASAREAERVQRERAERERDRAYLYRNAVPESADYVDALDHIMRTARRSRTQSRRLRWIEARARCALEGGEDWKELDLPRFSESNQRYLQARIAELEEALAAGGDQ